MASREAVTTQLSTMDGCRAQKRVQTILLRRIRDEWPPGTTLVPLRELSQEIDTAYGTLRGAVRSLVKAGYLTSTPRRGTFVLKSLSPEDTEMLERLEQSAKAASSLRSAESPLNGKTIEVRYIVSDDSFVSRMANAFTRRATALGAVVNHRPITIARGLPEITIGDQAFDFRTSQADASVVFNPGKCPVTPKVGCPMTAVVTSVDVDVRSLHGYDIVTVDQEHGCRLAVEALRSEGFTKPAFLGVSHSQGSQVQWSPTSLVRYNAFSKAWGLLDIPTMRCPSYSVKAGALAVHDFRQLSPQPDCVFAASDELAVGFHLGADAQGLLSDGRLFVMGFDGQQRARSIDFGDFATVAIPAEQMGTAAAELLITRFEDAALSTRRIHIGCSLLRTSDQGASLAV